MEAHAGGTPPTDREGTFIRALALHFISSGILLRATIQLEATPKPWPANVVRARRLLAEARGINHDAWEELKNAALSITVIQAARTRTPHKVGRVYPPRNGTVHSE